MVRRAASSYPPEKEEPGPAPASPGSSPAELSELPSWQGLREAFAELLQLNLCYVPAGAVSLGRPEEPLCRLVAGQPLMREACRESHERLLAAAVSGRDCQHSVCWAGVVTLCAPLRNRQGCVGLLKVHLRAPGRRASTPGPMSFETGCRKADRERFCKDFQKCFKGLPAYSESLREHCLFMLGQAARILGEELVAAEEAAASRGPRVLREAKDYIEAHCRRCLPLREVAAAVGVSPAHLSRLFSRHQGGGFAAAVRRERLRHAASMLSEARAPVTEVAFAAGFQSLSQFNRSFKAHYGLTPRAYRRSRQLRPGA